MRDSISHFFLVCLFLLVGVVPAALASPTPVTIPSLVVERIPFEIKVESADLDAVPFSLMIVGDGEAVYTHHGIIPATVRNIRVPSGGTYELILTTAGETWETEFRSLWGWLTLIPALLAILAALLFRQVYIALFAGIWAGAFIINGYQPISALFRVVDYYVIDAIAGDSGWDHTSIIVFTLLLGGLVGIVSTNGGTGGIVQRISRLATNARRGQMATWALGIFIFFDDYTNSLIVGNTMRPVTDRLRISREKLSYIVDSTAAPVAAIAVITSWVGFEISLLKDAFESVGMLDRNPFTTFVSSIPYSFYPIVTLLFVFLIARLGRDYGPMLKAERRALKTGDVLAPGASPIANIEAEITKHANVPLRAFNALIPILTVVFGTVIGLIITGHTSLIAAGNTDPSWFDALKNGNSFVALLWSSTAGCVVAMTLTVAQRILSLHDTIEAFLSGVKSMLPAFVILILAWGIGQVCADLHTADYLVNNISGVIAPELLPTLVFIVAAAIAFSTGTSWGTMTILTPLCIPLVIQVTQLGGLSDPQQNQILLASIASILSGAVLGDHCSPISDTTIMSSMASGADHIDHVRTQLPYALTVGAITILFGYIPTALGVPLPVSLLLTGVAAFLIVRFVGKPVDEAEA